MKWLIKLFTEHPRSVGETYWQHLFVASKISARLSIACSSQLIHGVLPFIKPPFKSDVKSLSLFLKEMDAEARKQKIN